MDATSVAVKAAYTAERLGSVRFDPLTWLALCSCFFIPETDIFLRRVVQDVDQLNRPRVPRASIPCEVVNKSPAEDSLTRL